MEGILKELKKETDRAVVMYKWDAKTAKLAFHKSVYCNLKFLTTFHLNIIIFLSTFFMIGQKTVELAGSERQLSCL